MMVMKYPPKVYIMHSTLRVKIKAPRKNLCEPPLTNPTKTEAYCVVVVTTEVILQLLQFLKELIYVSVIFEFSRSANDPDDPHSSPQMRK